MGLPLQLLQHVQLQFLGELLLYRLRLLLRLDILLSKEGLQALVGLWVLDDLRPARLGFGLEVRPTAAGLEREKRRPLLDLVAGDRLVVDEHDDGLLVLGRRDRLLRLGCRRLRGGLAGGCLLGGKRPAGCRDSAGKQDHRRGGGDATDGVLTHGRDRVRGVRFATDNFTAEPWSAIAVIHKTTVALAWQSGFGALFSVGGWDGPGIAPAGDALPSMSAHNFGPKFWSPKTRFS